MLQLVNIHKTFNPGTVNEKKALNGVNLQLNAGDFATIVGSNGAGKSTMFNAITGSFLPDEGQVILGGEDITFAPDHARSKSIGHLFQDPLRGTAPSMTIEENLALAYLRAGTHKHAFFSRISKADKELFRQHLALLDMGLEDRMKLTRSIVAEKQITCLMVTHNMNQALTLGNRTLMMDRGRIVFDVSGEARAAMTVDDLLEQFRANAGREMNNDRILLSKVEGDPV